VETVVHRNIIALIALSFLIAPSSSGAAAFSKRTTAAANAQMRQLLRFMDADKNGDVSKDEFVQFLSSKFDQIDVNKSGELERSEMASASRFGRRTNAAASADIRRLVRLMDADQNGNVSKDEFIQFISATFDRLDVNKSGTLEREELRQLNDPNWIICHDMHIC
jgi:Ca2+-binding EF-hand superfamily protein